MKYKIDTLILQIKTKIKIILVLINKHNKNDVKV